MLRPNPVKKALAFDDRRDPSTTKIPRSGNRALRAQRTTASWRSPLSIGVKVLKSGMIQVGATNCTTRIATVAAIQQPEPRQRAGPGEERQDDGQERAAEERRQDEPLEEIRREGRRCSPVEVEASLDAERRVDAERKGQHRRSQPEAPDVEEAGDDRAVAERADRLVEPREPSREPEGEQHSEVDRGAQGPEAGARGGVALRPGVSLGVEDARELPRHRGAERAGVEQAGRDGQQRLADEGREDDDEEDVHGAGVRSLPER